MYKTQIIALFLGSAEAVKYRPYVNGRTPWYKAAKGVEPNFDTGYFVPNFGVDSDILASQENTANAEAKIGKKFAASFKKPKGHPVDYFVPNFGVDQDIKQTQKNTAEAE